MDKTGYIYVLTNESFHRENWIKIGYAEDVDKRVKELSGTAVPLPYEVYCTYEIPRISGVKDPDIFVHDLIQTLNPSLRISQNREFFEIYPWDAYSMLSAIAKMHGRMDKIHRNEENQTGVNDQNDAEYSVEALFKKDTLGGILYEKVKRVIQSIDRSLEESPRANYVAFKMGKSNFIMAWPKEGWIEIVLGARLGTLRDDKGMIYDISNRKWSSSQYALKVFEDTDMDAVRDLLLQTYNIRRN